MMIDIEALAKSIRASKAKLNSPADPAMDLQLAMVEQLMRIADLMEKASVQAEQTEAHRLWLEDRQDDMRAHHAR